MREEEVAQEVFEAVVEATPHISSGLLHRREYVGEENPSDEKQMEADVWANEILKEEITSISGVGEFASEEEHEVTDCGDGLSVAIDPLDGSSNIPTNNLVGTIVGIYDEELPCSGKNLVEAFYVVYGPMTSIMRAADGQVDEYVVEERKGDSADAVLASEDIEIPDPNVYGFGGNRNWTQDVEELEDDFSDCLKLRYGGAFVGDINQVLHHGGVFGYPYRDDSPDGKLRLLFECSPVAFIVEQAGGESTNADRSILEVEPESLHHREPFFAGCPQLISEIEQRLDPDR